MIVKLFHEVPFDALVRFGRATTLEIAKHRAKNRTVASAEWKRLRESFSPKKQSDKVKTLNILFYAEGGGDVIIIGQTGQGYLNGVGGIFDVTELIKKAKQRKLSFLERDRLDRTTIKNSSTDRFELRDQNGIFQGYINPKSVTKIAAWPCKYILSNPSASARLYFNPYGYPLNKAFVIQAHKVLSKCAYPHRGGDDEPTSIELQII